MCSAGGVRGGGKIRGTPRPQAAILHAPHPPSMGLTPPEQEVCPPSHFAPQNAAAPQGREFTPQSWHFFLQNQNFPPSKNQQFLPLRFFPPPTSSSFAPTPKQWLCTPKAVFPPQGGSCPTQQQLYPPNPPFFTLTALPHPPKAAFPQKQQSWPPRPPLAHLEVGDVVVNVHGGGLAVLGNVLVVVGTGLLVHPVDAGDGHVLVAPCDIPGGGGDMGKGGWGGWPQTPRHLPKCPGTPLISLKPCQKPSNPCRTPCG